jgi:uncharacterized protein
MKNNTLIKLSNDELIKLDQFLRRQTSDMTLVKAHGFITAVVSFPELLMPSEWMPILVGELRPLHDHTPIDFMLEKLITMYRQINANLNSNDPFEFLLSSEKPELRLEDATYSDVQEWCNGFCLALVWNENEWLNVKESFITKACATFFMLTDLINSNNDPIKSIEWQTDKLILVKNLPDLVKGLYAYWLNKHRNTMQKDMLNLRHSSCPCGSKRQYRNCCWLEATEAVLH